MMSDSENLQNYAIIVDGKVVNVIVWDGHEPYDPGAGHELVVIPYTEEDGVRRYIAGIGWDYNPKATKNKWVDNRPKPEEE